ncbi:hypothetical protein MET9862_05128 [Methylobacterium symbioticum]|uniref:Uncharacterized protein n=1 Tax=Methylobacterium symbioticum TaxID=2584084 RepID=A0A509EJD8_9HYPH|nr:hypothetical protein MET9862_05128 [Methylobacterium symbioticum]
MAPALGLDRLDGQVEGHRRLVGPLAGERVEHIGHRDDAGGERDLLARPTMRVAAPVPALVMGLGNVGREADQLAGAAAEDAGAEMGVRLDQVELGRIELARLQQHGIGDGDLAHVVERRREIDAAA